MGFKFVRAHAVDSAALIENPYIIGWRKGFIAKIRQFKKEGRHIFYYDESYINW